MVDEVAGSCGKVELGCVLWKSPWRGTLYGEVVWRVFREGVEWCLFLRVFYHGECIAPANMCLFQFWPRDCPKTWVRHQVGVLAIWFFYFRVKAISGLHRFIFSFASTAVQCQEETERSSSAAQVRFGHALYPPAGPTGV